MKQQISLLILLIMGAAIQAQQLTQQFTFSSNDVQYAQTDGFDVISLPECSYYQDEEHAGEPQLPLMYFNLLLPEGALATGVSLTVNTEQQLPESIYLYPVQLPVYPNFGTPPAFVDPNPDIYNYNNPYPEDYILEYETNGFRDYNYVSVNFTPFRYIPLSRQLYLLTDVTITINYTSGSQTDTQKLRPYDDVDDMAYEYVKSLVKNPLQIDMYYPETSSKVYQYRTSEGSGNGNCGFEPTQLPAMEGSAVYYVIITNNTDVFGNEVGNFTEKFQEFADWKTQSGSSAKVVTVDAIRQAYPGVDIAEQIREFIKDAHKLWGTEYVLLGGNAPIVSVRWIYEGQPTDLYYSAIWHPIKGYNDNWNSNGNLIFGEVTDFSDFTPDIAVGRAPVDTDDEVELFLTKNYTYARCSLAPTIPEGAWLNTQLNLGGIVGCTSWNDDPIKMGIKSMWKITDQFSDEMEQYTMQEYLEDWKTSHPDWCPAYYPKDPEAFNQNCSSIDICDDYVEHSAVMSQIDQRYGIVNHFDHSGQIGLGLCVTTETSSPIFASDFQALSVTNKYSVFLSGGCHTAPIERNFYISEQWISAPNGGVTFLGTSKDILASPGCKYNFEFFSTIYNSNLCKIGWSNYITSGNCGEHKVDLFKIYQLLGDPELSIYTDVPVNMNVDYNNTITNGNSNYSVVVSGFPTNEAIKICLNKENEVYAITEVETGGTATFNITPDTPGTMHLTVTCHNANPIEETIAVTQTQGAHLYETNVTVIDENSNGFIEPGESVDLEIELRNSGAANATVIRGILTTSDVNTTISENTSLFPDINAGGTGTSIDYYTFATSAENSYNGQAIPFELNITSTQGNFTEQFTLNINTSKLNPGDRLVLVNGIEENTFEPGDIAELSIGINNFGVVTAYNVNAILTTNLTAIVSIGTSTQNYGDIGSFEMVVNSSPFTFTIGEDYINEPLIFELTLTNGFGKTDIFEINLSEEFPVNVSGYDFSSGKNNITMSWTGINNIKGYNIYRSNTENGIYDRVNEFIVSGTPMYYDAEVEEQTEYWYKISVITTTGNELNISEVESHRAWTFLEQHEEFPITANQYAATGNSASVTVADVDGDGSNELFPAFINVRDGKLMGFYESGDELFDIDGNENTVSGFAEIILPGNLEGGELRTEPAIEDINNDGHSEVFVTTFGNYYAADKGYLYGFTTVDNDSDNKPDPLWNGEPKDVGFRSETCPVIADLDGDGVSEIIVKQGLQKVAVYNINGNLVWEKSMENPPAFKSGYLAVGNLDNDNYGRKEIIFANVALAKVYIYNYDGSDFNGENPFFAAPGEFFMCNPVLADIDSDDDLEIFFISYYAGHIKLYALNYDKTFVSSNWNGQIQLEINQEDGALYQPAIGDIDTDGNPEIVVLSNSSVYIFDKFGNSIINFPIDVCGLKPGIHAPLLADIDEDDDIEIIVTYDNNRIYAFNSDGTECPFWRLSSNISNFSGTPTISDIDNDGYNEIVISDALCTTHVWKTTGDADKIEWGSYRANAQNTGEYRPKCKFSENYSIEISDPSTVWNSARHVQGHLIINANSDLTIHSRITFAEVSKIIIHPGGKLILDGGTLTNACGDIWQGIEVWGNPNATQIPPNQGILQVINGGTIENAEVAVRVGSEDYTGKGGGIVYATDASFKNNKIGVWFDPYSYSPSNASYFRYCSFDYDLTITGEADFTFAKLNGVDYVNFEDCDFTNNSNQNHVGIGIESVNSTPVVEGKCTTYQGNDCIAWEYGLFSNLYYAIYATAANATDFADVRHTTFTNNFRGIYLSGMTLPRVTSNWFYLNEMAAEESYGLYLDGSTQYWIEDNTFRKCDECERETGIGIYVNASGAQPNEIYLNAFDGVEYAVITLGVNRTQYKSGVGLVIRCNDYNNTLFDETIIYDGINDPPPANEGISKYQGNSTPIPLPTDMAGNLFYYNTTVSGDFDDLNNESNYFYYYYSDNAGANDVEPLDYTSSTVQKIPKTTTQWTYENGCPSNLTTGGGGGTEESRAAMNEALSDIESTETVLLALVDGGDTESLKTEVETSTPPETSEIYTELMSESPNLSETVVETSIEKEEVLTNAMIRDIMVANPHTSTSLQLLDKLDDRTNPMPAWMKAQILAGRSIQSLKTELEGQLASHQKDKYRAMNRLARHFSQMAENPAITDSLIALYQSDNTVGSRYMQAWLYLYSGQYQQGQNVMTTIPANFNLTEDELAEYENLQWLYTLLKGLFESGNSLNELSEAQIVQLQEIVAGETGVASVYARNILLAIDELEYREPVILPNSMKSTEAEEAYNETLKTKAPSMLEVYPNPSSDFVIIGYQFDKETEGMIEVRDVSGNLIKSIPVKGMQDQLTITTRTWKAGVYMFSLVVNGKVNETVKFTLVK